jgi:hypothetical protein
MAKTKVRRIPSLLLAGVLLTLLPDSWAGPPGGCFEAAPAGTWTSYWLGGPYYYQLGDGRTYQIGLGARVWTDQDDTGQWDSIQHFLGASACLTNAPGAPWYTPGDTNVSFDFDLSSFVVKARAARDPSTNIEMEIAGHSGRLLLVATYVGTPAVTNVPETADTLAYTQASASLSSARFCLQYDPPTSPGPPLSLQSLQLPSPRFELSWLSATNRCYQIQYCDDFSNGEWEDFQWPLAGTGNTLHALDFPNANIPQRFFRCIVFP